jgi:cold shock CspA family protein
MSIPLEIRFHNLDRSPALEAAIHENAQKLEHFAAKIMSCRVTVDAPHHHQHQGQLFQVTIDIHVPGSEIVVNRSPDQHQAHEDPYVALRDAFNAARRKLQDHVRVERGKVKAHEVPLHGRIIEIHKDKGYGRIGASDGREVYFHRNSVIDADFERLDSGAEVRFTEEPGDQGPQATTVVVIGKHHLAG